MAPNGSNRSGGYRKGSTGIITGWKMRPVIATGYSGPATMKKIKRINGICMDFSHSGNRPEKIRVPGGESSLVVEAGHPGSHNIK